MLFEDFTFDECYTDYDRLSDPNKNAAGEGTKQRITQAIGSEIDESTVPLISDMQKNIFLTKDMLSKFIGHKESEAGYSRRWGTWFSAQTPAFRKNVARIIDRLYRIRCTKLCHEIMFAWLGFGVTITEVFGMEGLDTIDTFDMPLHTLDSSCPRCTTYEVYITGSGGSLTADDIEAITAILKFNQPVDAQIADIFYNGVSVLEDFDQTDPDLAFNPYVPEDADAIAFIDAADIQGTISKRAIEILVLDLKGAGLWAKMRAVYPMIGGSLTSCKYNLKDPRDLDAAYRLTFFNSPTVDSAGVSWNGTTQYANTHFAPGTAGMTNMSVGYYSLTTTALTGRIQMGGRTGANIVYVSLNSTGTSKLAMYIGGTTASAGEHTKITATSLGLFVGAWVNSTTIRVHQNGASLGTASQVAGSFAAMTNALFLGAYNNAGVAANFATMKCGFAFFAETLTETEAGIMSTAINDFMTRVGKNTY